MFFLDRKLIEWCVTSRKVQEIRKLKGSESCFQIFYNVSKRYNWYRSFLLYLYFKALCFECEIYAIYLLWKVLWFKLTLFSTSNVIVVDQRRVLWPEYLSREKLKTGKLGILASEKLTFLKYFGLLVGHKIPKDNKYWSLNTCLCDIVRILRQPSFKTEDSNVLFCLRNNFVITTTSFGWINQTVQHENLVDSTKPFCYFYSNQRT